MMPVRRACRRQKNTPAATSTAVVKTDFAQPPLSSAEKKLSTAKTARVIAPPL